jgi:hypothetical protein
MQRTGISKCTKAVTEKTDRLAPPEMAEGMKSDTIEAQLGFGDARLARLKHYFWKSLSPKDNEVQQIL